MDLYAAVHVAQAQRLSLGQPSCAVRHLWEDLLTEGVWPTSLLNKLGVNKMQIVLEIKRAQSRDEVLSILEPYELTDDELAIAMTKMGTSAVPVVTQPVAQQRREARKLNITLAQAYAAMWRAGAAYRQIARYRGVAHQTVHTLASRVLGVSPQRDRAPIKDEQLAALWHEYEANPSRDAEELHARFTQIIDEWSD